eukprot:scaffold3895_cov97-Alexandrium_tamarense.AAC.9
MTEDAYNERVTFLKMLNRGSTILPELRKTYPQAYEWMKMFEVIVFGTSEKLVFKADATLKCYTVVIFSKPSMQYTLALMGMDA